ncbi:MAG TPA: N-acetylmuramoyl-L-alanine amidase [Magnetospirillaceae bacterium]|jgi:N-acetylmuramoyl-L-alanine amidase
MLVLHYTGMPDGKSALERMCDPKAQVSAHYMIEEDGTVFALVDEARRAWHAGAGSWRGYPDINSRSIGIELVNPGHEFGYRAFPMAQMEALAALAPAILARHPIPPRNVIAHADLAPARKEDPGELFDWAWLAARGIGLWPQSIRTMAHVDVDAELARWGYAIGTEGPKPALVAFQRHFRPSNIDGVADEETVARLMALLALVGNAP